MFKWNVNLIFKKDNNIRLQKKRNHYQPKTNLKLKFGDFGIVVKNEGRLEFVQLNFIKKSIKFLMRSSKHIFENSKKIWYNIVSNHVIQCKSKNSRMGKGKGLFNRRIIRLPKNSVLFEFSGVSLYKINFFVKKINKKLNFKTYVLYNKNFQFKNLSKHSFISNYYNKFFNVN